MKHTGLLVLALALVQAANVEAEVERQTGQDAPGTRVLEIADHFAIGRVEEPRVSPDGAWVAFTIERDDLEQDVDATRVWMVPTAGGEAIPMTVAGSSASDPRWSPDGRYLAFLSDRVCGHEAEVDQLFLLDRRCGEAIRLTDIEQGIEAYDWSPDGQRLVLAIEDPRPGQGKKKDETEEVTPPWVIDRLYFKEDEEGYLDRYRDHLYIFDLTTKKMRQITFGDYDDSDPKWSPDGGKIVFVSNRSAEPDANYNTDLWLVDPDSADPRPAPIQLTTNPGLDREPVWSPDGQWLAYITVTRPEWVDYAQTDVAVIRVGESEPRNLTADLDRMVYGPRFSPDSRTVLFRADDRGEVPLYSVTVDGGSPARLIDGPRRVEDAAIAADGTVVAAISEVHLPTELFALDPPATGSTERALRRLSHVNDRILAEIRWPNVEKVTLKSGDGTPIEAFIYTPPGFEQGRRYSTILWIHGGPMAQYDWGWDFDPQIYAANGYVVVLPNPRGSTGYGQEFGLAIWQAWGGVDYQDVMAAVDHAVELGYSDPDRLGVGGWSYGGILTNYVITSTERFKAAMSGASGALWVALYGHDQYQHWYEMEFGLPWENRELWDRLSSYNRVQHITTPTLWMGGDDDWNVPILTSEIMYQSMRRMGRDTLLVVYPGEDHSIDRPSYVRHKYEQWLAWFDRHLK
jgi:dipeptidyl aminopeptidase/acylaminoacyl peptidase